MRYFSTFTGAGGFEIALHEHECVGFSEIDKYASAVLKYHYSNIKNYGDIKAIDWSAVPDFDLLVGGSPCQDLSVAGKRKGLTGERSGLFAEFVRALQEKKPEYFIWENVKGALSSNNGWDFAAVQITFSEAGYQLWWQVLNAKDFGVPQNRERIFVVGVRDGSPREILFERQGDASSNVVHDRAKQATAPTLRANHHNTADVHFIVEGGNTQPFIYDDYNQKVVLDALIRRLTPTECERLMSWPDDHTKYGNFNGEIKEISDTQRYKMCGNGVVSKVVAHIVQELIDPINKQE